MGKHRDAGGIPPRKLLILQVILVMATLGVILAVLAATGVLFN